MATFLLPCLTSAEQGSTFLFVCGLGFGFGLLQVPIEIRPDIGTSLAAGRTDEPVFDVG